MRSRLKNTRLRPASAHRSSGSAARLILTAVLALLPVLWGDLPAAEPTPAQKEAELKRVQSRIDRVRKQVNADIEKRDRLGAELRDAELDLTAARRKLEETREQRIQSESQLAELTREQARREQALAAEREALAGELRAAYVNGREEQLKLLLNQEDPASFGRTLAWYGYFGRARAGRIQGIRDQLEHLALVREKIAAETERLRLLEERQQQELDALDVAQTRRTRAVAAVESQIKTRGGEITRLTNQARALERLIAELRKALEDVPVAKQAPFESLRGKLPWPVQSGKVLARFGQPRAGGSLRWQGMLVGTDRGARVRAPFAGRVVYADWLPGMGLMIVLDHGKGYMSLYGHNEELFRKVGEAVNAGDVIAAVGDSGGHNQPALYFEVRRGREPVNPENWLQRR
jgi:septal ring factor EnvC (AmiA/AmiB activator)